MKCSAVGITHELAETECKINWRTVTRHLTGLGLSRRRFNRPHRRRQPHTGTLSVRRPGHMAHLDVKNVGRIPEGGGWCIHGRHGEQAKTTRTGQVYLHSVVDGFARPAHTEALPDEKGTTAADGGPPGSRLTTVVTNVQPSCT